MTEKVLWEGDMIAGQYKVSRPIRTDKEVYRAEQWVFGERRRERLFAVKMITITAADPEARKRFEREAQIMSELAHDHLIAFQEAGIHQNEKGAALYIVMERANRSLENYFVLDPQETQEIGNEFENSLEFDAIRLLARQIALAIQYLHQRGYVHNDVKPGNILQVGNLWKLADFGLTHRQGSPPAGEQRGTLTHMAPEAMNKGIIDFSTDIWAFGAVLQQCLTKRRPYKAESKQGIQEEAKNWAYVPEAPLKVPFDTIVPGCLCADPDKRMKIADVLANLDRYETNRHEDTSSAGSWLQGPLDIVHTEGVQVHCIAVSSDGNLLLSGDQRGVIRLWERGIGQEIREIRQFLGHMGLVQSVAFCSQGKYAGKRILSSGADNTVRMWDLESGSQIGKPEEGQRQALFHPDGQSVLMISRNRICQWNFENNVLKYYPKPNEKEPKSDEKEIFCLACSPDGRFVLYGGADYIVWVWDSTTGMTKHLGVHDSFIYSLAFIPEKPLAVSAGTDRKIRLWNLEADSSETHEVHVFRRENEEYSHARSIRSLAVMPNGHLLLSGGGDGYLHIWKLSDNRLKSSRYFPGATPKQGLVAQHATIANIAYPRDGSYVAIAAGTEFVHLLPLERLEQGS